MATATLGYEISGIPQVLRPLILNNGLLNCPENVTYIPITETVGAVVSPIKVIRLNGSLFMFNAETGEIEEEDVIDDEIPIIDANTGDVIKFEKGYYVRQFIFDCIREDDQQNSAYQPLQGLDIDSSYQTIKTQSFDGLSQEPKHGDLIEYHGKFWIVEDTRETFIYTPREKSTLHISLKAIN